MFGPTDPTLRVALRDDRMLIAWRHAVSDAAGGIGFIANVVRSLAGEPLIWPASSVGAVGRRIWMEALTPSSLGSFVAKARAARSCGHAAFAEVGPIGPQSASCLWCFDRTQLGDSRRGPGQDVSFTGAVAAAVAGACFDLLGSAFSVTLMLPVNLRPAQTGRWWPAGNFVGNVELCFATRPSGSEATLQVRRSVGPQRLSAWLAAAAREALPAGIGRHGEGEGGRLCRTAVLNNLGAVEPELMPGVVSLAFYGPTAVDFPSFSLVGLGDAVTLCIRVRNHQGGADLAKKLMDRTRFHLSTSA